MASVSARAQGWAPGKPAGKHARAAGARTVLEQACARRVRQVGGAARRVAMGKELVLDEAITAEAENRVLSMKANTTTASKATLSVMSAKRLSPVLTASQKFDPVVPLLSLLNEARVWKLPTVKKSQRRSPILLCLLAHCTVSDHKC